MGGNQRTDSAPAYAVGDDTRLKMSVKTLLGIIGAAGLAAVAWFSLKADVSSHSAHLAAIQVTVTQDHDAIKIQGALIQQQGHLLERIDRKLDRLSGQGNRGGGSGGGNSP